MPEYLGQLEDGTSEASRHLRQCIQAIHELEHLDPDFLHDNRRVDTAFFELQQIPNRLLPTSSCEMNDFSLHANLTIASNEGDSTARVGYQSWTAENLCVDSFHHDIAYYTTRWDALCPYIDVSEEMLAMAPRPFVVYAIPPDSAFGVPINDRYGLVNTGSADFWNDARRQRKFKELDKLFRRFTVTEEVVAGNTIGVEDVFAMGGSHFADCFIHDDEVAGFVDYVQQLEVLVIRVHDHDGTLVLTDVSMLLPKYDQVYGSFCQWNRAFKNRSPGIYACLLAARWAARHGYAFYNLGPVDGYDYKSLFVTHFEPIYALALTPPDHPLVLDPTSPLHIDFKPGDLNRKYRSGP
jgi:hypothetical protein